MAARGWLSSDEVTTNTAIKSSSGDFGGVIVLTDGTYDATIIIYDNTSAAAPKLFEEKVAGGDNYGGMIGPGPVAFKTGLYASVDGTGASCIVYYR